jgi:A/G-specific adenine glycosylase
LHKLPPRADPPITALAVGDRFRASAIAQSLADWFPRAGRSFPWRDWRDPYRLAVVEILLQRTRAETVAAFAPAFFRRYPDWLSLASTPRAELEERLAPIGLQARRAASLVALAEAVTRNDLDPWSRAAPGIGQYISRAIRVGASNDSLAMVDSNWVRVLQRAFPGGWTSDYRYDARLQSIAAEVVRGSGDARAANWAVLDIGATVCLPRNPRCGQCPLVNDCETGTRRLRS